MKSSNPFKVTSEKCFAVYLKVKNSVGDFWSRLQTSTFRCPDLSFSCVAHQLMSDINQAS